MHQKYQYGTCVYCISVCCFTVFLLASLQSCRLPVGFHVNSKYLTLLETFCHTEPAQKVIRYSHCSVPPLSLQPYLSALRDRSCICLYNSSLRTYCRQSLIRHTQMVGTEQMYCQLGVSVEESFLLAPHRLSF